MSVSGVSFYADFPVIETIGVREISHVRKAVEKISSHYERTGLLAQFCVRILLPRGGTLDQQARKLGLLIQGEFLLSLRRKNLRPDIREIKYIHNENSYGWLFLSPKILEDQLVNMQKRQET
jgi:hypothetical protein